MIFSWEAIVFVGWADEAASGCAEVSWNRGNRVYWATSCNLATTTQDVDGGVSSSIYRAWWKGGFYLQWRRGLVSALR